jgi:hypothetical protein
MISQTNAIIFNTHVNERQITWTLYVMLNNKSNKIQDHAAGDSGCIVIKKLQSYSM